MEDTHEISFKKNIIIIVIAAVLAIGAGAGAIAIGVSNSPANRVSRYMGAAERYLSELDYEQAIIEYQRILEIEPRNVDAYIGLAKAYEKIGDDDKAVKILQKGIEVTDDKRLKKRLDKLQNPEGTASSSTSSESVSSSSRVSSSSSVVSSSSTSGSSTSSSTSSSTKPEPQVVVEPLSKFGELEFVGDYGYTPTYGTIDKGQYYGRDKFYAVKKVDGGAVKLKESKYPVFVSEDGYIIYYGYKTDKSVQVIVESPSGETLSETVIKDSTEQLYMGWGLYEDRIWRAFNECDFAFFEADDKSVYIFGKDGSVKNTKSFNAPGVNCWCAFIEFIGPLSYVYGNYGTDDIVHYYYLPDLDKVYKDNFPYTFTQDGLELKKYYPENTNYGTTIILGYSDIDPGASEGITLSSENTYYVIGNIATGEITKAYRTIETTDGKTFKAVDTSGKTLYLDTDGNEISH